jgi:hypothetical protein
LKSPARAAWTACCAGKETYSEVKTRSSSSNLRLGVMTDLGTVKGIYQKKLQFLQREIGDKPF